MKIVFLLLIGFSSIQYNCKKDLFSTKIKGQVLNKGNGNAIANATVAVIAHLEPLRLA